MPRRGWDGGRPGRRDRLPLGARPCPNATLRCSRTNGKVFPGLPSSWAQLPRLGSTCSLPLPSHLLCFGLCPLLPQTPTLVTTPPPFPSFLGLYSPGSTLPFHPRPAPPGSRPEQGFWGPPKPPLLGEEGGRGGGYLDPNQSGTAAGLPAAGLLGRRPAPL